MGTKRSSGGEAERAEPAIPLTRHDAHRYLGADDGEDRCSICGEPKVHIRHHPTRVRAALLVRGVDPDAAS